MSIPQPRPGASLFDLKSPASIAVYDSYPDAQKAVDYLADQQFPVENLCIVGTDLKSVERVLGRKTWGRVLGQGALNGAFYGMMIALIFMLFTPRTEFSGIFLIALLIGVVFGLITAAITYALSGGQRDFNSVQQTVATRYEVMGEREVAGQARQLLGGGPTRDLSPQPASSAASADYPANPAQPGYPSQATQPGYPGQSGQPGYPAPQGQTAYPAQPGGYPAGQQPYPAQPGEAPPGYSGQTSFDPRPQSQDDEQRPSS